jgi:hypothetical protein
MASLCLRSSPQNQDFTFCNPSGPVLLIQRGMLHACFPGVEPPLDVQLRLEVDGHPGGSLLTAASAGHTK